MKLTYLVVKCIQISALSTFNGKVVACHGDNGDGELGFNLY